MPAALECVDHRPWPLPGRPWLWRQTWCELLFAHWPVPRALLRPLLPPALELDEFEGTSWVGVVPFRMRDVAPRALPALPWLSAFPELNLRLYVRAGGRPGIWFLSLDAGNPLAVWAARRFFHLPYFRARMSALRGPRGPIQYRSVRLGPPRGLEFAAEYEPSGEPYRAAAGSLEHWLTERYCLYTRGRDGRLLRGEIHHAPWPLQPAQAAIGRCELARPHGFELRGPPPLLHYSERLDVIGWLLEPVAPRG